MAEGVLSKLVAAVLEELGKVAIKEAKSCLGARDDLRRLKETMEMVQARVHDAERQHEEEGSETIRDWLRRLRKVIYQADDLFDDILTVDRRRQKQRIEVNKPVCVSFSRLGTFSFNNWNISGQIKSIRKELDNIESDISRLQLNSYQNHRYETLPPRARNIRDRETYSFVNEEGVIGRENDKKKIIKMLFDPSYDGEKRTTVIPIVGFGGLGKTTLAQLVYNDINVRKHFNVTAWSCVTEVGYQNIHNTVVMRRVYQSFTGDKDSDRLLADQIVTGIQESIRNKKYLLVLDDIWDDNRNHWLDLLDLLDCGASGSRLIVTTRSDKVATAAGTPNATHNLGLLTEEESWNLFKKFAFVSEKEENDPKLAQIGKEIVGTCGNVPLAIKVVGSLLYSENSEQHWQQIRVNRLSKTKGKEEYSIIQVLKLSYDYLPPEFKQCFAYCSLFPKDFTYRKDDLINLWMAQGYIDPSSTNNGEEYFMELLRRNLFQDPVEDDNGIVKWCKMHDLVHDLAQHVAGEEIKQLADPSNHVIIDERLIHVTVVLMRKDQWEAPEELFAARNLRSLMLSSWSYKNAIKASSLKMMVLKFKSLRTLDLAGMNIFVVPNCIGKLRHLRFLNLANTDIECLPDEITKLDNLQTLDLSWCRNLKELPRDFCKLTNLRHLNMYGCYRLTDLPIGFEELKSLKELDKFIARKIEVIIGRAESGSFRAKANKLNPVSGPSWVGPNFGPKFAIPNFYLGGLSSR